MAWLNWTDAATPSVGEAADVLRREQLRVLDPVPQPERRPLVASLLEGVERLAVGQVADRVHGDRPAGAAQRQRRISTSASRLVISTPVPSSIRAVCEPSVPSMNAFR